MIPAEWLDQAALRIHPHIRRTLLTYDAENKLYLKWENQQVTGSFKVRGALNKVLTLLPRELRLGLVTASAGNHGLAMAHAGKLRGAQVKVFVSDHAAPFRVAAMRDLGADVHSVQGGYEAAEHSAIECSSRQGKMFVSPYNDGQVIAGQGTLGSEILEELRSLPDATWVIPVGGGGLLAGIGVVLERIPHRPKLIGVQAEASAFMHALYHKGPQQGVRDLPTLADGLAGPVELNALTIPLIRRLADDLLLVTEEEIGRAVAFAQQRYGQVIEGSGAVGLAAFLAGRVKSPAVILLTGGNIPPEVHQQLCQRYRPD